jgi:hypothetical protein
MSGILTRVPQPTGALHAEPLFRVYRMTASLEYAEDNVAQQMAHMSPSRRIWLQLTNTCPTASPLVRCEESTLRISCEISFCAVPRLRSSMQRNSFNSGSEYGTFVAPWLALELRHGIMKCSKWDCGLMIRRDSGAKMTVLSRARSLT